MTRIICRAIKEEQRNYIEYLSKWIPDIEWVYDEKRDAFDTFLRALKKANDEAVVFMECDTILCNNFREKLEQEIQKRPNEILQFFSMRKDDLIIGTRKLPGYNFSFNLCHYFPKGMTQNLLDYYLEWLKTERGQKNPTGYDYFMADFFRKNNFHYWIICPNLVNHRKGISTINKKRSSKRQSKTFEVENEIGENDK